MDILINDHTESFSPSDLPMLISGVDKAGASLFTIATAINFFRNGNKILFLSAYPMAIEKFMELLTEQEKSDVEIVENETPVNSKRAILIKPGDEDLFIKVHGTLPDANDRILILKNFERYTKAIEHVISTTKLILSGNVDEAPYLDALKHKRFTTSIFFSKPKQYPVNQFITLEKYTGMITNPKFEGIVKLRP